MSVDSLQFCNSLGLIMGKGFKVTSSLETITAPNVIITCTCKAEVRRTQVNDQKEFADIIYGQITSALEDTEFAKGLNRTIVTKDKEIEELSVVIALRPLLTGYARGGTAAGASGP